MHNSKRGMHVYNLAFLVSNECCVAVFLRTLNNNNKRKVQSHSRHKKSAKTTWSRFNATNLAFQYGSAKFLRNALFPAGKKKKKSREKNTESSEQASVRHARKRRKYAWNVRTPKIREAKEMHPCPYKKGVRREREGAKN